MPNAERDRIAQNARDGHWDLWGPYLSERQWGTVREDYSANGDAWTYLPHDHARSRAYRWGEDGIGGISDAKQRLCLAFAFWNERDQILKERLFGLTNPQGNHGEDVKEIYFYEDCTPTNSYMRMTYRYPQAAYPYDDLVRVNGERGKRDPEFELSDTGLLTEDRLFEIQIEYAKASADEFLIRICATNCGPDAAPLHIVPTLWFRNTWTWGVDSQRPMLQERTPMASGTQIIDATHHALGTYSLYCQSVERLVFAEKESNIERLWGVPYAHPYVKDSINDAIVHNEHRALNPNRIGTKAAAHYRFTIPPGQSAIVQLRFSASHHHQPFRDFDLVFAQRKSEADEFYASLAPSCLTSEHCVIMSQAFAGILWSKQFYYYVVEQWLDGDPSQPAPPTERLLGRNSEWRHLYNERVMSMPDKWEYPWYAAWDLAFHCLPLALLDPHFAKHQLDLIVREWYQHPNGQIPAYEWNFSDVNPPVIGWAAWRVYQIERKQTGHGDRAFLETVFHKLLINFTWWVNRKDRSGRNIFEGGFLGLDNIGVFDRSAPLPTGGYLEQADGTAWMALFCQNMLEIAVELAKTDADYGEMALKFVEHFLWIASSMAHLGEDTGMWDEEDGFFYDVLRQPDGRAQRLKVRSMVGLLPLYAVTPFERGVM